MGTGEVGFGFGDWGKSQPRIFAVSDDADIFHPNTTRFGFYTTTSNCKRQCVHELNLDLCAQLYISRGFFLK